jgi:hypothetical protein
VQALGGTAETAFLKDHQKETEFFEHGTRVIRNPHHRNNQPALSASRAAIVACFASMSGLPEQRKLAGNISREQAMRPIASIDEIANKETEIGKSKSESN